MNDPMYPEMPSIVEMGYRALALWAVLLRWLLETKYWTANTKASQKRVQADAEELQEWTDNYDVFPHMTTKEQVLFYKPFGEWPVSNLPDGFSWNEMLVTLLWGVRILDVFPNDVEASPYEGWDKICPNLKNYYWIMDSVGSRSRREMNWAADYAWCYFWRTNLLLKRRNGVLTVHMYQAEVSFLIEDMVSKGLNPKIIDCDLAYSGASFEKISQIEAVDLHARMMARLACLGWLLGWRKDWDEPLFGYYEEKHLGWLSSNWHC